MALIMHDITEKNCVKTFQVQRVKDPQYEKKIHKKLSPDPQKQFRYVKTDLGM